MVRFKNRWLLVEFISYNNPDGSPQLNTKQIWSALRDSVVNNFGDVGWGAVGNSLNVKYYSPVTGHCIIRVARDHYRIAWGATTLITSIDGKLVLPHVIHCSGTIKKVQIATIRHDREAIARLKVRALDLKSQVQLDEYAEESAKEIESLQD